MSRFLDIIRNSVRQQMRLLARFLNSVSRGHISPNAVTYTSLVAHLPIAWLIATNQLVLAGVLLIFFGLLDTLDGELARLQGKASPAGMLLDASTDRMKEIVLYIGLSYYFVYLGNPAFAVWATAAAGGSILVSYVKAKGETAVKDAKLSANQVNRLFQDGLLRYEVRMFLLVVGLFINVYLSVFVVVIAVLSWLTAVQRLNSVTAKLR